LFVVGRLRPGLTYDEADSQLAVVASRMAAAFPSINGDQTFTVGSLSRLSIGNSPEDDTELSIVAGLFMAMAGIVLLIACINLANMLLARGATRHKEFAVRVAIGAGRGRILRQLLAEGLMLAVLGGVAGLFIAYWASNLLAASMNELFVMSTMSIDIIIHAAPDYRVLSATAAFCALGTLLFGLGPAWKLSRPDVMASLKEQAGELQEGGRRGKAFGRRNLLVVSQIALSLVLLIAAGLFVRGAVKAADVDPGFSLENGLIVEIDPSLAGYDEARSRDLYRRLHDRLARIPGVETTSVAATVPFGPGSNGRAVRRAEDLPGQGTAGEDGIEAVGATYNVVGTDYFATLGLKIKQGRVFSRSETENDGGPRVAIVDELLAERLWPDEDPLGRQIGFGRDPADRGTNDMEVVGVVPTIRDDLFASGPEPHVYVPHGQDFQAGMNIHIRTSPMDEAGVAAALQAVRGGIKSIDEQISVMNLNTLDNHIAGSPNLWLVKMGAKMFSLFGALALFLAVVGVYGVKAYTVAQRSREIGIRMALGASTGDTLWLILREGLILTSVGLVLGLVLAAGVARLLTSMLYEVSALDPVAFIVAPVILAAASLLATYLPARRAAGVDPIVALRHD